MSWVVFTSQPPVGAESERYAISKWITTNELPAVEESTWQTSPLAYVVFESEEKARARESDPRRTEGLQRARAMMAEAYAGPPQFTDLVVEQEWTGR